MTPKISHWVYVHNPTSYPEWTKIGRTKNLDNREDMYNCNTPLKENTIEPVLKCSSLEDAHYIEQTVLATLSEVFETSGEWIKCASHIVKKEIQLQYMVAVEYPDFIAMDNFLFTKLETKTPKERILIAEKKIKFWETVKRGAAVGDEDKKELVLLLLDEISIDESPAFLDYGGTFVGIKVTTSLEYGKLHALREEDISKAIRSCSFFDSIRLIEGSEYYLLDLESPDFPAAVKEKCMSKLATNIAQQLVIDLPLYKNYYSVFEDPKKKIAFHTSKLCEVWSKKFNSKNLATKLIKKGIRQLPCFLEENAVKRICGKPERCIILSLEGGNALPQDVIAKL